MSSYFVQKDVQYDTTPGAPAASPEQLMSLLHQVSEHFGCFVIYAYDYNGNPLKLGVQTSQMEDAALHGLVKGDILGEIEMIPTPLANDIDACEEFDDFDDFDDLWDEDDEDDFFDSED